MTDAVEMDEPQEECECGEEDCVPCARAYQRWLEDIETKRERDYQSQLWGPDGLLFDSDDPICKERLNEEKSK